MAMDLSGTALAAEKTARKSARGMVRSTHSPGAPARSWCLAFLVSLSINPHAFAANLSGARACRKRRCCGNAITAQPGWPAANR
jgi:hypothetical protein